VGPAGSVTSPVACNDEASLGHSLGHGAADNRGHEGPATATSTTGLTSANAQDQRRCAGWTYIHTAAITEFVRLFYTILKAGLRAAACGGRPRPASDLRSTRMDLPRRKLSAGLAGGRLRRSGTVRISSYFCTL
jgi:hypothetical protein